MRLLVTRPEADGEACKAPLEAAGHRVVVEPLTRIEPCPALLALDGVQALVATSRNALRALEASADLTRALKFPIFVVGPATAALARNLGFANVIVGPGAGRDLAEVIAARARPETGALLHLAGDQLAFDLAGSLAAKGYAVRQVVLYRSLPVDALSGKARALIATGDLDGVIFMSPRASRIFTELIVAANLEVAARDLIYFCLSEAVARSLSALPARRVEVAREPDSENMLRLVNQSAKQII